MQQTETPKIRVVIRKRPLSKLELGANQNNIIDVTSKQTLIVREEKLKLDLTKYIEQTDFVFDTVFDEDRTNIDVYKEAVRPLVQAAFSKQKVSCFAYGQTGSGKTYLPDLGSR